MKRLCGSILKTHIKRLTEDHLIEKIGEVRVDNVYKAVYRKTGVAML